MLAYGRPFLQIARKKYSQASNIPDFSKQSYFSSVLLVFLAIFAFLPATSFIFIYLYQFSLTFYRLFSYYSFTYILMLNLFTKKIKNFKQEKNCHIRLFQWLTWIIISRKKMIRILILMQYKLKIYIKVNLLMSSPSKLFSCIQANNILRSPTNNSTAKNHWSFSKDERFKNKKLNSDAFYNIPDTKSTRKAGFGYGKKTDLEFDKNPLHVVPPPNTYNLRTFVDINKEHKKGFTPRYSRQVHIRPSQEIAPVSYIDVQQKKVPGPGRYEQFRYNESPRWSLHSRTYSEFFPQNQTTQRIVPGPGAHEAKEVIHPIGKYYLSNHNSSKVKAFNPPRSKRFAKSSTDIPPPNNYHPKNDLPADGNYVLSKNKSSRKRAFLMGRRDSFVQEMPRRVKTPGPGSYRIPSQFGQYDEIYFRKFSRQLISKKTDRTKAEG